MKIELTEVTARKIGALLRNVRGFVSSEYNAAIDQYLEAFDAAEAERVKRPLRIAPPGARVPTEILLKRQYVDLLRQALTAAGRKTPMISGIACNADELDDYISALLERCENEDVEPPVRPY